MALYPVSTSARMEPLDEPEPTAADVMCECWHFAACRRIFERLEGPVIICRPDWKEALAARLGCDDCEDVDA